MGRHAPDHGVAVHRIDEAAKVLAFRRRDTGGPGDEVVVAANFAHETRGVKCIGFRAPGSRRLRRDTDWAGYSDGSGGVREP